LTKAQGQKSRQEVTNNPGEGVAFTTRLRGGGTLAKRQESFKVEGQVQVSEEIQDGLRYFSGCLLLRGFVYLPQISKKKKNFLAMQLSCIDSFALKRHLIYF
jgi:hypothetical protein